MVMESLHGGDTRNATDTRTRLTKRRWRRDARSHVELVPAAVVTITEHWPPRAGKTRLAITKKRWYGNPRQIMVYLSLSDRPRNRTMVLEGKLDASHHAPDTSACGGGGGLWSALSSRAPAKLTTRRTARTGDRIPV